MLGRSRQVSIRGVAARSVGCGLIYGTGLGLMARAAGTGVGLNVLGIRAGAGARPDALTAALQGGVMAAALCLASCASGMEAFERWPWVAPSRGWLRGLAVGAAACLVALAAAGAVMRSRGALPNAGAFAGLAELWLPNLVAAGLVASFGGMMWISPSPWLPGARSIGYWTFVHPRDPVTLAWLAFLLVPAVCCFASGRIASRRRRAGVRQAAVRLALLWAGLLALLAWLLRVEFLSDVTLGGLGTASPGTIRFNVAASAVAGGAWGLVMGAAGARSARGRVSPSPRPAVAPDLPDP